VYRALADPQLAQLVEEVGGLRRDEQPVAGTKLGDPLPGTRQFLDPVVQVAGASLPPTA